MPDQQTIEQAIIGKRIVAVSWLPAPLFGSAFELKVITLEGGVKLNLRPVGYEGMVVVEIEESEDANT